MAIESNIDPAQLAALKQIPRPQVAEIVTVYWPEPDGTLHYASKPLNLLPNYQNLALEVDCRLTGNVFLAIKRTSAIADETITLSFSEVKDKEISRLFRLHGEGIRVQVFYYFPQVELLTPPSWSGLMRTPQRAGGGIFRTIAASGFRSVLLPLPGRRFLPGCQAVQFGGLIEDLAECLSHDCPYAYHLDGVTGQPDENGQPFETSATNLQECIDRHGTDEFYLGFDTVVESIVNNQTKGPSLYAKSHGNEPNLKSTLRVNYGPRIVRDLDLLAYTPQTNTKHPDKGFVRALFAVGDGRYRSLSDGRVNDLVIGMEHVNYRRGERGQARTSFSPNVLRYSRTALFFAVYGPVDPAQYGPGNLRGQVKVEGRDEIRVYTDAETFTEEYTTNRAWCLLDVIRDRRWGHKLDPARFWLPDFIALAAWCDQLVGYSDASGNHFTGTRSTFVAELTERTAQQQINDICLFGRFTLPFEHEGYWRIQPLEKVAIDDTIPLFTDEGINRNIMRDSRSGISSVTRTVTSDAELVNQILLSFDDRDHGNIVRPLIFADQKQQARAGKAVGDTTLRVIEQKYSALGVDNLGEAVRLGNLLLDLGEFDQGGLKNNLRVTFITWYWHTLELHPYKPIRVVSKEIEDDPFQYFRILSMERRSDLTVEIVAQAYPEDYYEQLEDATEPPPRRGSGADPNPGGGPRDRPCQVGFLELYHSDSTIEFVLQEC